jgi:hypothetical protein
MGGARSKISEQIVPPLLELEDDLRGPDDIGARKPEDAV